MALFREGLISSGQEGGKRTGNRKTHLFPLEKVTTPKKEKKVL